MEHNTLDIEDYIWGTLLIFIIAFEWYKNLFFIAIPGKTEIDSEAIMLAIVGITIMVNLILTIRWSRNNLSLIKASLIPLGIYAYFSYKHYLADLYQIISWVTLGVFVMGIINTVLEKDDTDNWRLRFLNKARKVFSTIMLTGAIASVALMACLISKMYIGGPVIRTGVETTSTYGDKYKIAENIDTVLLLQDEEWDKLTVNERIDVLQCVCNIEGNYLGLNKGVRIYASKLKENLLGYYNDSTSSINISIDLVEAGDPYETLECVCHQMCHAAQCRYIDIFDNLDDEDKNLYFLDTASVYSKKMREYKNGYKRDDLDFMEYSGVLMETDARDYAQSAVRDYYKRIDEYLENKN